MTGTTKRILIIGASLLLLGIVPALVLAQGSPHNDNFANAEEIFGRSGNVGGSNAGAGIEPGEPTHFGSRPISLFRLVEMDRSGKRHGYIYIRQQLELDSLWYSSGGLHGQLCKRTQRSSRRPCPEQFQCRVRRGQGDHLLYLCFRLRLLGNKTTAKIYRAISF